jgi:hypothetical protein
MTTNQIPTTQNEAFMWSEALCGVCDCILAATVRRWKHHSA